MRRRAAAFGAAAALLFIAGCNSAAADAAQAVYDECGGSDLVTLDGDTVRLEMTGDAARAAAGHSEDVSAAGIMLQFISAEDCLIDATLYPGRAQALEDGDEWDGWRYSTDDGAGSEIRSAFTATD